MVKYNSNSKSLNEKLIANGDYVQHGSDKEKVLGYLYDPVDDTLSIKIDKINLKANTKREVLAEVSKVFDPLSLGLPVTIGGQVLLRDLWKQELGWDDKIPSLAREGWDRLSQDLLGLRDIKFERNVVSSDLPASLYLFSDAAKSGAYGFVAYLKQGGTCHNVFAKA